MSLQKGILLNIATGMEDKIISTKGLCMLVTDEGTGFFDDRKNVVVGQWFRGKIPINSSQAIQVNFHKNFMFTNI